MMGSVYAEPFFSPHKERTAFVNGAEAGITHRLSPPVNQVEKEVAGRLDFPLN